MKKLIALLLALVMVIGLVACGNNEAPAADAPEAEAPKADAPAADAPAASDEKVTVTMIAAQYGNETADWWVGFEEKFEAANNGIDLVVDVVSWNDIYTVVNTRIANGEAPDLLNIDVFADYQADGLLLPAEDWVSEETYAKFFPSFLEQSIVDDVVWAVPDLASARALYYNADILEAAGVEVPTTWEELKTVCEAIKAYDAEIYPWGVDMTTDEGQACFAYYAWNNGGGFVDEEGNWTLNSAENVEAVNYIVGLVKDGLTNTDPTTETRYDLQEMFASGKVAMMIGPNQISKYCEANGGINYGIASLPTNGDKAGASVGVMDRIMCFDNGYTDAEMAAVTAVVDAFYDDEPYAEWVLMEDFLPATSSGNELCAQANPGMAAWIDVIGSAKFYPAAKAEWADVKLGVIDVLQQVLLGEDAQTMLDDLQADIAG
ncbi:MAG: extracellular solute-binding protein [Oscillospiraceae bacterium]|nr:extracellular solute-binding protein [Oscillospiraceae bacterium]